VSFVLLAAYDISLNNDIVDIKELKLLGGFNHPNIVRFVSKMDFAITLNTHSVCRLASVFLRILEKPLS
jgi:hypothetical protein